MFDGHGHFQPVKSKREEFLEVVVGIDKEVLDLTRGKSEEPELVVEIKEEVKKEDEVKIEKPKKSKESIKTKMKTLRQNIRSGGVELDLDILKNFVEFDYLSDKFANEMQYARNLINDLEKQGVNKFKPDDHPQARNIMREIKDQVAEMSKYQNLHKTGLYKSDLER
jgi:hypothetical protein